MKTIEECPCEQCLTKAICRNRKYHDLTKLCEPLADFLHIHIYKYNLGSEWLKRETRIHKRRVLRFQSIMKPIGWAIGEETEGGFDIVAF